MNKNKITGAIYGVAVGDAMGAPTELRSYQQIKDYFGGTVTEIVIAPNDTFAGGYPLGTVTDDFSMTYYLLKAIIDNQGNFNYKIAKEAIIAWGNDDYYFDKFSGPTTRMAIDKIRAGLPTDVDPLGLINFNAQATNGGAMKVIPIAILAKGNRQKALDYAFDLCKPTHFNSNAISAAAAVACAACSAQKEEVTLDEILSEAVWGANKGKQRGEEANKISVGIDLGRAIERAIVIGQEATNYDNLMKELSEVIGTSFQVSESIPAIFGIIAGTKGNLMDSLYVATNIGGDTDTMAAILGGILGGYCGIDTIPKKFIEQVKIANPLLDFSTVISEFSELVEKEE